MKVFHWRRLFVAWYWPLIAEPLWPDFHCTGCCYFYFAWGPIEVSVARYLEAAR